MLLADAGKLCILISMAKYGYSGSTVPNSELSLQHRKTVASSPTEILESEVSVCLLYVVIGTTSGAGIMGGGSQVGMIDNFDCELV